MEKILELITREAEKAFEQAGYSKEYGKVVISNRPDLCEFQCNGAMAAAKAYGKKPFDIADEVQKHLVSSPLFEKVEVIMPGFININISAVALSEYLKDMYRADHFGIAKEDNKRIIVDYGGANVAKPLHIGHLRSAVIGETIKRLGAYFGNEMIGDVHLGDWGLQMGLIIEELRDRKPELVYFDENFTGEYPQEAPFTISDLEEIYPFASAKSKEDEAFKARAQAATLKLQTGYPPFTAIWKHIIDVSVTDLKKNYDNLDVSFELWKGESDAQEYIPDLIKALEEKGLAYESEGALVVDIGQEGDSKELPPCIIRKSDGAALYATSDLGTIIDREKTYAPDRSIYVTDARQSLHFVQVFRVSEKAGFSRAEHELVHIGFGTMNGKGGKPLKTRDGGVIRLEHLISDVENAVFDKIKAGRDVSDTEAREIAKIVGLAALKYGDLSNQASKDYIFDIDRFTSFEGNTGPYILYTMVRIKSILNRYEKETGNTFTISDLKEADTLSQKKLCLELARCNDVLEGAWREYAPHKICQYIYQIAESFNAFYHEVKILSEEDETKKKSYIALLALTRDVLADCIHILGFEAPDRM